MNSSLLQLNLLLCALNSSDWQLNLKLAIEDIAAATRPCLGKYNCYKQLSIILLLQFFSDICNSSLPLALGIVAHKQPNQLD